MDHASTLGANGENDAALSPGDNRGRLQALLDALPVAALIIEGDTLDNAVIAEENAAATQARGVPLAPGTPLREAVAHLGIYGPDRREPLPVAQWPGARALASGETVRDVELHVRLPDGEWRVLLTSASPLRRAGEITGAVVVLQDITREKTMATALSRAADQATATAGTLRALLDILPAGVLVAERSGQITLTNQTARTLLGGAVTGDAHGPRGGYRLFRPDGAPYPPEELPLARALDRGEETREAEILVGDGFERTIIASGRPILDAKGQVQGAVAAFRDITEWKRAEESTRWLAAIVESSEDAIIGKDLDGVITHWNPAAERLYGYTAAEVVGRSSSLLMSPEHAGDLAQILARLRQGERVEHLETVHVRKDDTRVDVSQSLSPVKDAHGTIVGAATIARDITERKAVHERLRESEARLEAVLNQMPAGVAIVEAPSGKALLFNEQAVRIMGEPARPVKGVADYPIYEGFHLDGRPYRPEERPLVRALTRGETVVGEEMVVRRADGSRVVIRANAAPIRGSGGRVIAGVIAFEDITERRRDEEREHFLAVASTVLTSSLDYKATLERVASLAVPGLADWCFVDLVEENGWVRRVAVAHADPDKAELAGRLRRPYAPKPDAEWGMSEALRSGRANMVDEVTEEVLQAVARDPGHLVLLRDLGPKSFVTAPLMARGEVLGAVTLVSTQVGRRYGPEDARLAEDLGRRAGIAIDNARLYEAEQRARAQAQEADAAKDQFMALVSHELRNPLNAISSGLFVLRQSCPAEGKGKRALEIVERNTKLQARLVGDLLDLSRLQRGKLPLQRAPVELGTVVAAACQDYEAEVREAGLDLICDTVPGLWVHGDFDRLQQVVMNLLTNAVKFTPPPGRITVSASHTGEGARIAVSDTGIGISPDLLPNLFESFRQGEIGGRRSAGLGLGLALVRGIIERHGGRVWAESEGVGKGSRFIVELPLVSAPVAPSAHHPVSPSQVRAVVVEDNADTRTMIAESLALAGYQVRTAGSGEDALGMLEEARPDMVLVDIGLPGMDGYEFMRRARALPGMADVPAFAVTGYGTEDDVRRGREVGFAGHFVKPVDVGALDRRIREWLGAAAK